MKIFYEAKWVLFNIFNSQQCSYQNWIQSIRPYFGVAYVNPSWWISISLSVSFNLVEIMRWFLRVFSPLFSHYFIRFFSISVKKSDFFLFFVAAEDHWKGRKHCVHSVCINDDEISDSVIIFNGTFACIGNSRREHNKRCWWHNFRHRAVCVCHRTQNA